MATFFGNHKETGNHGKLYIGGNQFPITNVSWSIDNETESMQYNTSLNPSIAITGKSMGGSFEHAGSNQMLHQALMDDEGTSKRIDIRVDYEDDEGNTYKRVRFKRCVVTSKGNDQPSDGRTSKSYDFEAEAVKFEWDLA